MLAIKIKNLLCFFFSKEATNKDKQFKTQMLVSFEDDESKYGWKVFF